MFIHFIHFIDIICIFNLKFDVIDVLKIETILRSIHLENGQNICSLNLFIQNVTQLIIDGIMHFVIKAPNLDIYYL